MDIYKAIRALYEEKKRLEELIGALEELQKRGGLEQVAAARKRRGRKSMSLEERLEVSERMKKYWAEKRKQARRGEDLQS